MKDVKAELKEAKAALKEIYDLFDDLAGMGSVRLRVFNSGCDGTNVSVEACDSDGDAIDHTCPLLEITPKGELIEQRLANDDREPLEILRDVLEGNTLDKQVNVRLSNKELVVLRKRAKAAKTTVSALIRKQIV